MRTTYEEYAATTDSEIQRKNNNSNNSAIPYHARENSLPFSYGQISKTSTPLRSSVGNSGGSAGVGGGVGNRGNIGSVNCANINGSSAYRNGLDFDFGSRDVRDGNSNSYSYERYNTTTKTDAGLTDGGNNNSAMIKTQPHLTSPLLVRKTLSTASRSPTRGGMTNTIANTYPYQYNGGSSSGSGSGGGSNVSGFNGNLNSNYNNTLTTSSRSRSKTPTRKDFEESLLERRERVFNEYRTNTAPSPQYYQQQQQQHHMSNTSNNDVDGRNGNTSSSAQQRNKFQYDFEFNLNLDDVPPAAPTRRVHHTMEQQRSATMLPQQQQQQQPYRIRDISPVRPATASQSHVERNYYTISSSNAIRETQPIYAKTQQQQQKLVYNERPPLEEAARSQLQSQSLSQSTTNYNRRFQQEYATNTAHGNGNVAGYGYNNNNNNNKINNNNINNMNGSLVAARNRNDASLSPSPIYATTTKQMARNSSNTNNNTTTSSYRSINELEMSYTDGSNPSTTQFNIARPETPAFPVTPRTPYGANNVYNPVAQQHSPIPPPLSFANGHQPSIDVQNYTAETIYQTNNQQRPRLNSSLSLANSEPQEVAAHLVKFAKDSSKFWYKPNLSREEAIQLLLNAQPGTFIVRDSTTYKNAYGLVLRVAQPPPSSTGKPDELVRHFLIEPTTRGVRLKGCANEPVFTSLSALVYEHSINQLALPCLLRIPEQDLVPPLLEPTPAQKQLITMGAACNVLWLFSCETESLTGEEAIRKAIRQMYAQKQLPTPTEVHFKVTQQGITLTDNTRKKFFRKHYTSDIISYCAIDPDLRLWTLQKEGAKEGANENGKTILVGVSKKTIFAFVARKSASSKDNQCHVFCDLDINQPASAIVSFVNKTLPTEKQRNYVL